MRLCSIALTLVVVAAAAAAPSAVAQRAHPRKHHKKAPPKPEVVPDPVPAVPETPPPPPVPMDEAAVPPKVTFDRGNLTIEARNSTLSDVLKDVEKLTGASFEISSGDTSERVVGIIGPGSARDVLATLLNGSHFNYVMLSPLNDPSALSRVLLTPRGASLAQNTGTQPPPQFQQQIGQPIQISPALQVQQQNATDETTDTGEPPDDNAEAQPQEQPDGQTTDPSTQQPPPPGVKSPEQMLQELRQQQQVIQQQQVPQGGQPPVPNDNK